MDKATVVGQSAIAADKWLTCDSRLESLDAEHVVDDLFRHKVDIWVHKSDMVIAGNDITQSRESLFNSLDAHSVRQ